MENNYLKENLKYLKVINGLTNKTFGQLINKEPKTVQRILNGKRSLTRPDQLLICDIFNLSLDQLLYKNLKESKLVFKMNYDFADCEENQNESFFEQMLIMLHDDSITDKTYLFYYKILNNILNRNFNEIKEVNLIEMIDFFINYFVETGNYCAIVNALSAILFGWIIVKSNSAENNNDTNFINYMKTNLTIKQEKGMPESQASYVREYDTKFLKILTFLEGEKDFKDLAFYYLCLKTYLNFNDPDKLRVDDAEARSIGYSLLKELSFIGNKYAIKAKIRG